MQPFLEWVSANSFWLKAVGTLLASGFVVRMIFHLVEYYSQKNSTELVVSLTIDERINEQLAMVLRTVAMLTVMDIAPNFWRRGRVLRAMGRCNSTCHVVKMSNKADAQIVRTALMNKLSARFGLMQIARLFGLPIIKLMVRAALVHEPLANKEQEAKGRIVISTIGHMRACLRGGSPLNADHGPRLVTLEHMLDPGTESDPLAIMINFEIAMIDWTLLTDPIGRGQRSLTERIDQAADKAA